MQREIMNKTIIFCYNLRILNETVNELILSKFYLCIGTDLAGTTQVAPGTHSAHC
jgi:hypothetical protein